MKIDEFIECTIDELLAAKRNSFSRNIVLQHKDMERHEELFRLKDEGVSGMLATYLFTCKNLTIHAIDEKQTPISFEMFERIYRDAVFLLQYLSKKNAYALTLFRNTGGSNDFTAFFNYSYYSGSNMFKVDRNSEVFESLLDFGLVKCAMTMDKTYGIQDLLEVAWKKFCAAGSESYRYGKNGGRTNFEPPKAARFIFNVECPKLSIMTCFGDNELNLFGKTRIIDSDIDKATRALEFLDSKYNIITKGKH